ncbi:formamidopyrimidine-DNA glycosylase [Streptococcus urinalis FB127-CNA-2]|uniref:Formamidopyrimidine-DNA glycosylase n=1 Tax=Streptococcus urinalis 2285-97 TaxID=764291 RepID=G5KIF6_9STRE|nr:DNA-formamidopyrimidine glycosylase [Streptococcus urinalis]EHJ57397.1 DNA-formamidopyrimidine glycosylase [Streptococcus urinalis 2285-97]EKS17232.1 formamidopyrimidine-DNA glycosylase [Streptococcus urinalis FB127-CNA-2]VEF32518.1 formamidopyrimidine-DNA glycosylase [Streptococcus urinalis]
MPELPEVEIVRRGLEALVIGRQIKAISIKVPKMVKPEKELFKILVEGQHFKEIRRRGKYLIIVLEDCLLISHLRMEGKYLYFPEEVPENKHFHVYFYLENGATLVYQDVRKFGTMEIIAKDQESTYFEKKKLGPEPRPETFTLRQFEAKIPLSKKEIKPRLLDQQLVAGLGNIYVDEVLWAAKVHPAKPCQELKKSEIKRIHDETIRILSLGIEKGGSTIRTYRNALGEDGTMQSYLKVYGKQGQPCPRCQEAIVKIQLKGRGTHFCPQCQKR